jgi:hypothetical protein
MILTFAFRGWATAIAGLFCVSVVLLLASADGPAQASHAGGMDAMTIDMDPSAPPANTATSIGSIQSCARINENGVMDADEDGVDTMTVDVLADNIPSDAPMNVYQYHLGYSAGNVSVQFQIIGLLATAPGSIADNLPSDPLPDSDGLYHAVGVDFGPFPASYETGSGFLDRLFISSEAGAVAGEYALTLSSAGHQDGLGFYPPDAINDATVAVNQPCGGGPPDADLDGVADGSDNCMTTANAFQGNQDADGLGDACDPDSDADGTANATDNDDDNDGVFDTAEGECRDDVDSADANTLVNDGCPQVSGTAESGGECTSATDSDGDGYINDGCPGSTEVVACGGDPLSPSRRPERTDGPFAAVDDDGDTAVDEVLPGTSPSFDCDGDGWPGDQENLIYLNAPSTTRDQDPCGNNGWPSDLAASNALNIADIGSFLNPARSALNPPVDAHSAFNRFSHPLDDWGVGGPGGGMSPDGTIDPEMARWNLALPPHLPATLINIADLNALITGAVGSGARPPMFGGAQAFYAGPCPWTP